jgi:acyl-coenzyme A synthetase/AMP-(fatty) acid ligase
MPLSFWRPSPGCIAARNLTRFVAFAHAHHGGCAVLNDSEGIAILPHAAAVLESGGVRICSARICRQVERLARVLESPATGQHWQNDARVVPFARPRPAVALANPKALAQRRDLRELATE